jgi:hypothetical protein
MIQFLSSRLSAANYTLQRFRRVTWEYPRDSSQRGTNPLKKKRPDFSSLPVLIHLFSFYFCFYSFFFTMLSRTLTSVARARACVCSDNLYHLFLIPTSFNSLTHSRSLLTCLFVCCCFFTLLYFLPTDFFLFSIFSSQWWFPSGFCRHRSSSYPLAQWFHNRPESRQSGERFKSQLHNLKHSTQLFTFSYQ